MHLPENIIIVEDEVVTRRYLKDILVQYDVNVIASFESARNVMQFLQENACDMVLMDINIKGAVDGIQLAKKILAKHTLPVVFITAYSDEETLEEVLELSPYGFITKPFSSKEIKVTLQIAYKRFLTDEARLLKETSITDIVINDTYTFSLSSSTLYRNNVPVKLNAKQTIFVEMLVRELNRTVTFEILIQNIWENNNVSDSALRTLVYSVRKLTPDLPIHSYSKKGYYLTSI